MKPKSLLLSLMTISVTCGLLTTANISSIAKPAESMQEKEERERIERRGKVEKARREIENHLRNPERSDGKVDYQTQMINELAVAEINYDAAKKSRDKNRSGYIIALCELANANFANKEYAQASKYMSEAYSQYELLDKNCAEESTYRNKLWQTIGMLPTNEFQPRFEKLYRITEGKRAGDQQELIEHFSSIPNMQEHIDLDGHFDKMKFFKSAVEIRAAARGQNDPSLYRLLDEYGRECELHNDLADAEKAYVQMSNLNSSSKEPRNSLRAKVRLARFYVDHNQFDKAEALWPELSKMINPKMHSSVAGEFTWLASEYIKAARLPEADKITSALLAAGGDTIVSSVHSVAEKLIESYTNSLSFEKAQTLLIKRVKASDTCERDWASSLVRLELSNIDLALGQEAESKKLFDEVKKSTALKGLDLDKMIADRAKLEEALKK
ncbi:MAG: hypothetical protein JST89_08515 [Cyanobacteria bacterium SZAS-4]|nr:hypothetical protein [Cyanobacteria bacterium SZAS-4]